MSTSQVQTVTTGAEKVKLAAAAMLLLAALAAFYMLGKQGTLAQWGGLLAGLMRCRRCGRKLTLRYTGMKHSIYPALQLQPGLDGQWRAALHRLWRLAGGRCH